jgi:hypothetical protein
MVQRYTSSGTFLACYNHAHGTQMHIQVSDNLVHPPGIWVLWISDGSM